LSIDVNRPLSAWHSTVRKLKLLQKRTTASNSIPVGAANTRNDNNNNNNSNSDDSDNDDMVNSENNKCKMANRLLYILCEKGMVKDTNIGIE
jgi:hypothetical protein